MLNGPPPQSVESWDWIEESAIRVLGLLADSAKAVQKFQVDQLKAKISLAGSASKYWTYWLTPHVSLGLCWRSLPSQSNPNFLRIDPRKPKISILFYIIWQIF